MKKCKELFAEYNIILILVLILGYGVWFVPYFASANNVYKLLAVLVCTALRPSACPSC